MSSAVSHTDLSISGEHDEQTNPRSLHCATARTAFGSCCRRKSQLLLPERRRRRHFSCPCSTGSGPRRTLSARGIPPRVDLSAHKDLDAKAGDNSEVGSLSEANSSILGGTLRLFVQFDVTRAIRTLPRITTPILRRFPCRADYQGHCARRAAILRMIKFQQRNSQLVIQATPSENLIAHTDLRHAPASRSRNQDLR